MKWLTFSKIASTITKIVLPLYISLLIRGLIFVILLSPSGFNRSQWKSVEYTDLASALLFNLFYATPAGVLVIYGLKPSVWNIYDGESGGKGLP